MIKNLSPKLTDSSFASAVICRKKHHFTSFKAAPKQKQIFSQQVKEDVVIGTILIPLLMSQSLLLGLIDHSDLLMSQSPILGLIDLSDDYTLNNHLVVIFKFSTYKVFENIDKMEINKNEINNDLPKKGPTYLEILFILYCFYK